jgi:sulfur-carrier protein
VASCAGFEAVGGEAPLDRARASRVSTPGDSERVDGAPSVTLLLFAAARQAAGTGRELVQGTTVGEVVAAAEARHGAAFTQVVAASRVWVNGEPAASDLVLAAGDEVAVLPPVSGGQ